MKARLRPFHLMTVSAVFALAVAFADVIAADIDTELSAALRGAGFTGQIESTLERRLGRPIDRRLAELGRLLFFDKIAALRGDNACAGCHSPTAGFGDTQSIAIGIQNNNLVGQNRRGPRNQRRTPTVVNTAFFPNLMWNGRFFAPSDDPFAEVCAGELVFLHHFTGFKFYLSKRRAA